MESGFLSNVASGCFHGPLCGGRHVCRIQVFQHYHRVVFADDGGADLMQYGFTQFRDALVQSRDFGLLLFPVG